MNGTLQAVAQPQIGSREPPERTEKRNQTRARRGKHARIREITLMQKEVFALVMDKETASSSKASLILSWDKLEERKRILRNHPLPGSLRPEKIKQKKSNFKAQPIDSQAPDSISVLIPISDNPPSS